MKNEKEAMEVLHRIWRAAMVAAVVLLPLLFFYLGIWPEWDSYSPNKKLFAGFMVFLLISGMTISALAFDWALSRHREHLERKKK